MFLLLFVGVAILAALLFAFRSPQFLSVRAWSLSSSRSALSLLRRVNVVTPRPGKRYVIKAGEKLLQPWARSWTSSSVGEGA